MSKKFSRCPNCGSDYHKHSPVAECQNCYHMCCRNCKNGFLTWKCPHCGSKRLKKRGIIK